VESHERARLKVSACSTEKWPRQHRGSNASKRGDEGKGNH